MKNYKRIFAGLFLITIFFVLGFTTRAEDEIIYQNPEEFVTVTCNYNSTYNSGTTYTEFGYRDQMLLEHCAKEELSPDLATVSAALATTAYNKTNIAACLNDMGYTAISWSKWYETKTTYEDNDHVAYVIANKKVMYQGEVYNLYMIPVRGTPGSCEWYSNFNVGEGSNHQGFYAAANEVIADFQTQLDTSYDADHTIVWTMGHSRGAAVANIIAAKMTLEKDYVSAANVFGYTYACPNVSIQADTELKNIYNFNNLGDPVTAIPLESWGFKRFGQTIDLAKNDYENTKHRYFDLTNKEYTASLSTKGFVDLLGDIASTQEAFNDPDIKYLIDIVAFFLGGHDDSTWNIIKFIDEHSDAPDILKSYLKDMAIDVTVAGFKMNLDSALQEQINFAGAIALAISDTDALSEEEWSVWVNENASLLNKISEELYIEVNTRDDLQSASDFLKEQIDDSSEFITTVCDILFLFWDSNGNPVNSFFQGHAQETYVLWINSMYFGYMGWFGNIDIGEVLIDKNISYIAKSCFENSSLTTIVLPDILEIIADNVFCNCDLLEEIIIPQSVKKAGTQAFYSCDLLKKIEMPVDMIYDVEKYTGTKTTFYYTTAVEEIVYTSGRTGEMRDYSEVEKNYTLECMSKGSLKRVIYEEGIKKIGAYANYGCTKLMLVELPESLETIGNYGFYNCDSLKEVIIPNNVKTAGELAFASCGSLEKIKLPVDLEYDVWLQTLNKTATFYETRTVKEIIYTSGESGEKPGYSDAYYTLERLCKDSLEKVSYGEGIKKIGAYANYNCTKLASAELPESLETIGAYAFYGCSLLEMTELPEGLQEIGAYGFANSGFSCEYIDVEQLGEYCFKNSKIKKMELGEKIKEIPESAFNNCDLLKEVIIPNNVRTVGELAFANCGSLEKIKLPVDLEYDVSVGATSKTATFYETRTVKEIIYTSGESGEKPGYSDAYYTLERLCKDSLEKVSYGEGIKKIGAYANYNCTKLASVELPESLETIGVYAFNGCSSLANILIPTGVDSIGDNSFKYCASNFIIYGIKESTAETYASQKNHQFIPLNYPMISPEVSVVTRGTQQQFEALVYTGISQSHNNVEWSITGNLSRKTKIDSNGLLIVGADEGSDVIEIRAFVENGSSVITLLLEGEIQTLEVSEAFSDVIEGQWYIPYVQYVYENGLMSGNGGLFTPDVDVTRAMVVETLYKLEGRPEVADYSEYDKFTDLKRENWWSASVAWALKTGIATGDNYSMLFNPEDPVTREQLATFLCRYADYKEFDTSAEADLSALLNSDKVSGFAVESMKWAVASGMISGMESTDANGNVVYDLGPQSGATRAQLAAILQRFCEGYHL